VDEIFITGAKMDRLQLDDICLGLREGLDGRRVVARGLVVRRPERFCRGDRARRPDSFCRRPSVRWSSWMQGALASGLRAVKEIDEAP
jgi:hypothetical protein